MNALEDRVTDVLRKQAAAMDVPDAQPGDTVVRPLDAHARRAPRLLAGAAAAAIVLGGLAAIAVRDGDPRQRAVAPADVPAPAFVFETSTVRLEADSIVVGSNGVVARPTGDVDVNGDPGMHQDSATLELTWFDEGGEQRLFLYFASDGTDWWASEVRTYDGPADDRDWAEAAVGEWLRTPIGQAYRGDLQLANVAITGMTLEAFTVPDACLNPTAPYALRAGYPRIVSAVGGFGVNYEVLDTATCMALPVEGFAFEVTSDDPSIVTVRAEDVGPDFPATLENRELSLLAPGQTVVRATIADATGAVVASTEIAVTVEPGPSGTPSTTAPPVPDPAG
jgi:hypothetical protein